MTAALGTAAGAWPRLLAAGGATGVGGLLPSGPAQHYALYPTLFFLVAGGSLMPVLPTGTVVSTAAVIALHQGLPAVALAAVFVTGASAAFAGDVALYWLGRRGSGSRKGSRQLERLRRRASPEHLEREEEKLREHGIAVLVLSRLVPAGRVPVMVACLVAEIRTREFVRGNIPACLVWTATYQVIGALGGSLFSEPWEAVAAVVGLTLLISAVPRVWQRLRPGGGSARGGRRSGAGAGTDSRSGSRSGAEPGADSGAASTSASASGHAAESGQARTRDAGTEAGTSA